MTTEVTPSPSSASTEAGRALDDVVVLDLTRDFWSGVGAALLADFGAQVIRIETTGSRDREADGRGGGPRAGARDHLSDLAHRNKLSLDLATETATGRQILDRMIEKATVLVIDGTPGEIEALGFPEAELQERRPGLIVARGTGFGPLGPDRDFPPLDELAAARTGMMPLLPQPGQPPIYSGAGEMYSALMLAFGVTLALHHRDETGEGQIVDASLLAGNMYGASLDLQAFLAIGGEQLLHPMDLMDTGNPMSGTMYAAEDGRWVTLTMPDTDRWWPEFSEVMGIDPVDPRFDTHAKRCEQNGDVLIDCLQDRFRQQPADHWRRIFDEKKLSADIVEEFTYPANDPQALRNQYILDLDDSDRGRHQSLGFPIVMSESPARLDRSAPTIGQDSVRVLNDLLGLSKQEIQQLVADGYVS
ncbi:CoA transferase [Myxococcota bacterium]|nr:CoA transferase [Myxococcota bacterium]